ncbi:MAG: hypothetical protein M0P29_01020 [Sphaerochaetaceae bacterium]|nr:hypothetical protein [Sphaerochaetaceae bacterium]
MEMIESILVPKTGNEILCEDGLFFDGRFAAVIDGCSASKTPKWGAPSPGVVAKNCCLRVLSSLPTEATMHMAFSLMDKAIHDWYVIHDMVNEANEDASLRCGAYVAIVSAYHRQVWVLGDCQVLVDSILHAARKDVDVLMETLRAFLLEADELRQTEGEAVRLLEPIMQLQPLFQNNNQAKAFWYPALDGFLTDMGAVKVFQLSIDPVEVVLATDGYPVVTGTLKESERLLAKLLESDPLCFRENRATKGVTPGNLSYDDRTYLRLFV